MNKQNTTVMKLAETALLAALCYVSFTFLQIKIPVPGGDATSLHIGNTFCVLGALLLGGWYGGLAGAIGMTIADLMDPGFTLQEHRDLCAEALHRPDHRTGCPQACQDQ